MHIGIAVKHIRTKKNLTQEQLARLSGLSRTTISQIETGLKQPQSKNLRSICEVLSVPESTIYLYGLELLDVPDSKKELFKNLHPILQNIIDKLVLE